MPCAQCLRDDCMSWRRGGPPVRWRVSCSVARSFLVSVFVATLKAAIFLRFPVDELLHSPSPVCEGVWLVLAAGPPRTSSASPVTGPTPKLSRLKLPRDVFECPRTLGGARHARWAAAPTSSPAAHLGTPSPIPRQVRPFAHSSKADGVIAQRPLPSLNQMPAHRASNFGPPRHLASAATSWFVTSPGPAAAAIVWPFSAASRAITRGPLDLDSGQARLLLVGSHRLRCCQVPGTSPPKSLLHRSFSLPSFAASATSCA